MLLERSGRSLTLNCQPKKHVCERINADVFKKKVQNNGIKLTLKYFQACKHIWLKSLKPHLRRTHHFVLKCNTDTKEIFQR